ncbi:unnamed protein product [Durusdinium trenchii]|uniref:Uncharacterized protein n=1 Tax=Durusdinium trenchii TaxID=1381693 RepID=A0ABP0IWM1_9DINO
MAEIIQLIEQVKQSCLKHELVLLPVLIPELQVETEARWALQRSLWDKPWLRGVAQSLLSAFQGEVDLEAASAKGEQRKLQKLLKRHTLQLSLEEMKEILKALDKGISDEMVDLVFGALSTSKGTVDIDTLLQWLFQDQLL